MTAVDAFGGWPALFGRLLGGEDLSRAEASAALTTVLAGEATPAQIAGFIVALRLKGETVDELAGMVEAMRAAAAPLSVPAGTIDIVGTGGSPRRRVRALNVSTMASIVAASAGVPVCKHGNRKASSTSGSFDLLDALGVAIDLDGPQVERCLDEVGIGFCFARGFHPAMRHAGPVRAELGVPTVFNVLGPLSHPGDVRRQVLGVGDERLIDLVAGAIAANGAEHSLVVHGCDSLDELTITGMSAFREVRAGVVVDAGEIDPRALGLRVVDEAEVPGGGPEDNAALARALFEGAQGPVHDIVVLNAGAGVWVGGLADSLAEGVEAAAAAIADGRSGETLARLLEVSTRIAGERVAGERVAGERGTG